MSAEMTSHPLSSERAETLFEVEKALRDAAVVYAGQQNPANRKALREAAISYADFANYLDELAPGSNR